MPRCITSVLVRALISDDGRYFRGIDRLLRRMDLLSFIFTFCENGKVIFC